MDIYKCPKSKIQKNFPNKNFNILNNKLKNLLKDQILNFQIYFIIYIYIYMNRAELNQSSREYINDIRHNGSLSDDLVDRLNMYIRANTILINENDAYNIARFLFKSFPENTTDEQKIARLNGILNDMAEYLVGIIDETEPEEHENLDHIVNDIYALIRNNNIANVTNNANEQNNVPYNTQGGKRRRGKRSKRTSIKIRRKRTRRYRR
jgi:hypothetical protein